MITLYSTWWAKPEKLEALKPALQTLAKAIKKNEAGTLMYLVNTPRYDFPKVKQGKNPIISEPMVRPGTIVFMEQYKNWEAFETHLYGPYFTHFVKANKSKFVLGDDGKPFVQVVFLQQEVGFKRKLKTLKGKAPIKLRKV